MKIENLCINCMKEKASAEGRCEHCGFDPAQASVPPHHLAPFVILAGKYLVGRAIGEGGFGITYIGMDLNLEMRVAIKEYYPNGCAIRDMSGNSSTVQSYAGEQQVFFEKGREKFINEAKVLAKCMNLPGIVGVRDFFQENHTAYIVMEYVDGKTLKAYLKEHNGRISAQETLTMMAPVIQSLGAVHNTHLIHRDISPDNIMISQTGMMKVLDFGGARDFVAGNGKSMSIMLKPGYAPEEQYRTHGEQGPWTDVYALCATMYRCITGEIPPDAMDRTYQDQLKPISSFGVNCPPHVEQAILKGLSVYKNARFQSMEELYAALYGNGAGQGQRTDMGSQSRNSIPGRSQGNVPRSDPRTGPRTDPRSGNSYRPPVKEQKQSKGMLAAAILGGILMLLVVAVAVKVLILDKNQDDKAKEPKTVATAEKDTKDEETEAADKDTEKKVIQSKEVKDITPTPIPTPTPISTVAKIDMGHVENLLRGRNAGANTSLYIYDLNQKAGRGTGNCEEARPASALITLPILYATAKRLDLGTLYLTDTVPFEYTYQWGRGSLGASQNGEQVTIQELLENMLMYSDNNAINTMINTLTLEFINTTCQNAGYTSVDLQRKIISGSSSLNNYMSAKDAALFVSDFYNNTFKIINRDFILQYMRISDKAGRLGLFQTDMLYNAGNYCSQNGIVPDTVSGRYTEAGIIFADGKAYVIGALAEGGNADTAAGELSDAAVYIHSCMREG